MTRILAAVDVEDAQGAAKVGEAARKFAEAHGAELHVVTVVPDSGMAIVATMLPPDHSERIVAAGRAALEAFAGDVLPDVPGANLHVARGTIYDQIIRTADRIQADTIVVGSHRPEFRDYLVGPNAARVVRHASQSVYVVR